MQKKQCVLSYVLCGALALTAFAATGWAESEDSSEVLAIIGEEKITDADLDAKIEMLPPRYRSRYQTPDAREKLLERAVKFSLLAQEARRLGLDKEPDVAKKINEITDNILIKELTQRKISDDVTVTDEEINAYYDKNKDDFYKKEKIKAQLIHFALDEKTAPEKKEKARLKAEETLNKLKAGADFDELAKQVSDDRRTKRRGGNTGYFSRGRRKNIYGEQFEEAAFSLKPGEISGIVESKNGLYIIKVTEKREAEQQSLEAVKARIQRRLEREKQKEAYENYIQSLEKRYPVKMIKK